MIVSELQEFTKLQIAEEFGHVKMIIYNNII